MISLVGTSKSTGTINGSAQSKEIMSFVGLSTDEKPTGQFNGSAIANGSVFIAMDSGAAYMYDEDNSQWREL